MGSVVSERRERRTVLREAPRRFAMLLRGPGEKVASSDYSSSCHVDPQSLCSSGQERLCVERGSISMRIKPQNAQVVSLHKQSRANWVEDKFSVNIYCLRAAESSQGDQWNR